ncbi:hypothetical protein MTO96_020602 [Rhipicephalus appendiculatus]
MTIYDGSQKVRVGCVGCTCFLTTATFLLKASEFEAVRQSSHRSAKSRNTCHRRKPRVWSPPSCIPSPAPSSGKAAGVALAEEASPFGWPPQTTTARMAATQQVPTLGRTDNGAGSPPALECGGEGAGPCVEKEPTATSERAPSSRGGLFEKHRVALWEGSRLFSPPLPTPGISNGSSRRHQLAFPTAITGI